MFSLIVMCNFVAHRIPNPILDIIYIDELESMAMISPLHGRNPKLDITNREANHKVFLSRCMILLHIAIDHQF